MVCTRVQAKAVPKIDTSFTIQKKIQHHVVVDGTFKRKKKNRVVVLKQGTSSSLNYLNFSFHQQLNYDPNGVRKGRDSQAGAAA